MRGLYTKTGQAPVFCWSAPCPNPSSGSPLAWHWPTWLGWWCWHYDVTDVLILIGLLIAGIGLVGAFALSYAMRGPARKSDAG